MELTHNTTATIPPRVIDYPEAARLLMDQRHLVLIGAADIPIHERIFAQLVELLPGQCTVAWCQAEYRPIAGPEFHMVTRPTQDGRAFTLLFAPDTAAARLAMVVIILPIMPRTSHVKTVKRLAAMSEPPIVFLEDPENFGDPALWQSYAIIASGLQAVAEGKAIDPSSN